MEDISVDVIREVHLPDGTVRRIGIKRNPDSKMTAEEANMILDQMEAYILEDHEASASDGSGH